MRLFRRHSFWRPFQRRLTASLALLAYVGATLGFPLPAPVRNSKDASRPYPCQNRPCGCLTAEQCWAGDCCCFTLEEKLAWAEANGIEPPEHVRPLVEARKSRRAQTKEKPCCTGADPSSEPSVKPPASFCEKLKVAGSTCCRVESPEAGGSAPECPHCAAKAKSCESKRPTATQPAVHWLIGIFAQKCRGEGPWGLTHLDPVIVSDLRPTLHAGPEPVVWIVPRSVRLATSSHCPPTPPPRCS
jgi:hypothetical protein